MSDHVFFIAEAGVNHNGDVDLARRMIDVAADAGADAVKFQTFNAASIVTPDAARTAYQIANTKNSGSQYTLLKALELSAQAHVQLKHHAEQRGIEFLSTAFDMESLTLLQELGVSRIKIPSGDITAGPLLLASARLCKPIILSTGMSTLADIEDALGALAFGLTSSSEPRAYSDFQAAYRSDTGQSALARHVTLLHCVTEYPAPAESLNLNAMRTLATAFGLPVGYSDHSLGSTACVAAAAMGASVLEKHFTLDRTMPGPDHAASMEPAELAQLVRAIRDVRAMLGSKRKTVTAPELPNRILVRRTLVAAHDLPAGHRITAGDLVAKRPATGLSPMRLWDLVGASTSRGYRKDEPIEELCRS